MVTRQPQPQPPFPSGIAHRVCENSNLRDVASYKGTAMCTGKSNESLRHGTTTAAFLLRLLPFGLLLVQLPLLFLLFLIVL